jgi:ribosomal protein S18 acetylase RimI-like enzyme
MMFSLSQPTPSEAALLKQLACRSFDAAFGHHYSAEVMADYMGRNFSEEQLAGELSDPTNQYWVAKSGSTWVGYLKIAEGYIPEQLKDRHLLEIQRLYVLPEFLGKGVGQLLMEKATELARELGYPAVWLGVWEYNHRALRFYEKLGFQQRGTHPYRMTEDLLEYDLVFVRQLDQAPNDSRP